jgi:hypothetical protein
MMAVSTGMPRREREQRPIPLIMGWAGSACLRSSNERCLIVGVVIHQDHSSILTSRTSCMVMVVVEVEVKNKNGTVTRRGTVDGQTVHIAIAIANKCQVNHRPYANGK